MLEVFQTADTVEITAIDRGARKTNRYPLDGTEVSCTNAYGSGKCTARLKGKQLVLDWNITPTTGQNPKAKGIHKQEFWELSADTKKLTIRTRMDFPDQPAITTSPGSADYARVDVP
jgi:hypothetical protein